MRARHPGACSDERGRSGTAWDLRCEVRERLLEFVQQNYPQCLPRNRNEPPEIHARVAPADGNSRSIGASAGDR
jgi:hypothetical protein